MGSFEARSGGEPQREKRREGQGGRVGCLSRACRQRGRCTPWHLLPPAPSFFGLSFLSARLGTRNEGQSFAFRSFLVRDLPCASRARCLSSPAPTRGTMSLTDSQVVAAGPSEREGGTGRAGRCCSTRTANERNSSDDTERREHCPDGLQAGLEVDRAAGA